MRCPSTITLTLLALGLVSCAGVQFERGPYAIRDLEVVYSAQEDVTFLSWRLRQDAKLDLVSFEIWEDDAFLPIELDEAPFPAEPQKCGAYWCFQYQVPGEYELPFEGSPMRSIHVDDGLFMGPPERSRQIQTSFDIDPMALGHNEQIDPGRFDWFADNEVHLVRGYQWQFTAHDSRDGCAEPRTEDWTSMTEPVEVAHAWTDRAVGSGGVCFSVRPDRRDEPGEVVQRVLRPSAENTWEVQEYVPPKVEAPIVWGLVLDLEVPNADRCARVKGALIDMIESSIAARGESVKLGIYTPTDPESGQALGGCDQTPTRDYPLEQMMRDAQNAKQEASPKEIRVLWIFANNIELPPSDRILNQLELFGLALLLGEAGGTDAVPIPDGERPDDPETDILENATRAYTWAIGSNVFMELFPWDVTTPWRPVEDQTFSADIKSNTKATLPFTTMRHSDETEVPIRIPAGADGRPSAFKVCDATPNPIERIGVEPGRAIYSPDQIVPWPPFDDTLPYYMVLLEPQILVPRSQYVRRSEQVVVEVCTAFCNGPFRTQGGEDYDYWNQTRRCQWEE